MPDPRFDPAFQRGYSGPEPTLVVRQQAATSSQAVPDVAASVLAGVPAAHDTPRPAEPIAEVTPDPTPVEPWQQPRRNPFAIALLASGLLMLVLGGAMIWSTATVQNVYTEGTFDAGAQALSLVNYLLPPALLLGGVLGILAWLVLGALGALGTSRRGDSRR